MTITAIDESGYWASYHQEKHDKVMKLSVQVQVDSQFHWDGRGKEGDSQK